ncbi:LysR substrate-binding domain-containing protein [Paraburkholderia haematera]|uniref:Glycine cleavage system transcriptional activator n=1 Tax=Paraburkholderia haematera TaxID=2793077 RepID=A0ABN7LKH9_9BURK|nr:LysR substrate-binding domain-containing protein [Paraburkholderia haematera]CAE6750458.1 Glycine cleavage system transcriptional activator [Paraburkholderia haematera]
MRKLPPLSALKTFEAAARHRHFGRAADELCVTHSAISHQVRSLEEVLKVTLFEKQGRQVHLTDAGLRLLHSVQQALDMMAEACSDAAHPGMRGSLKISAPAELAHRFFPRVIGEFSQRYPGLTIHLLVHDSDSNEINPGADITILYSMGDTDWARYWAVPFRAIEFFPVCHPSLVEGEGSLQTPADLVRFCLLHDDQDGKTWATWLGTHAASLPAPARNLHFAHSGIAIEAALQKVGVCLADTLTAGDELKSGRLIRPFAVSVPSPGNYYLVAERRKRTEARLVAFMQFAGLAQYLCEINSPIEEN